MKSLRKTVVRTCALLAWPATLLLASQAARQPTSRPAEPRGTAPRDTIQQPSDPPLSDAQAKITVNSNLVVLPVTVKDAAGNLVPDLRKSDFRVFEDKVEQNIDVFTSEAFPLSMVILIDNDLKDKDAAQVQASLDAIVAGLSESDEAFVCRFDQFFHSGKGFTHDQDKLQTELKRTNLGTEPSVGPAGGPFSGPTINNHSATDQSSVDRSTQIIRGQPTKALDDAVYNAAQLLHDRPRSRRRVILLISDGVNGGRKFNTFSYGDVIKNLLRENIAVYSVAVQSAYLDRRLSPVDRTLNPLLRYANDSAGEVYHATSERSFEEFYSRMAEEARYQYTLAYVPRGTDHNAEHHSVEVRVERKNLNVKTREGYYTGSVPTAATP
jgi:Ca-activated chloride channel family protein